MSEQAEDGVGEEEAVDGRVPLVLGENEVDPGVDHQANDEDDECKGYNDPGMKNFHKRSFFNQNELKG